MTFQEFYDYTKKNKNKDNVIIILYKRGNFVHYFYEKEEHFKLLNDFIFFLQENNLVVDDPIKLRS